MEAYILIVQEDFTSQQLLKQFLTSNGYNVDCADDGLEGIHMYKENDYDLIILGVNLPNLDGFSVCTMIRRESQIPIIFVTRANTEEDQIRGFELLCDDYITKPFSYKLLLKRVEAVLRRAKIEQKESYIEFEKIKLNLKTYSVEIDDEFICKITDVITPTINVVTMMDNARIIIELLITNKKERAQQITKYLNKSRENI